MAMVRIRDTEGLLTEPLGPGRRPQSYATWQTVRKIIAGGSTLLASLAAGAGHGNLLGSLGYSVRSGGAADLTLEAARKSKKSRDPFEQAGAPGPGGGEANLRWPNRASFAAQPSRVNLGGGFHVGQEVVHSAGHQHVTILGPSRSKRGLLKVRTRSGEIYRVSPVNLQRI